MSGRRDAGARLGRWASWIGLVLPEADTWWGPPEVPRGALPGGNGARNVWLEHGPERMRAGRVGLGAPETSYSREAQAATVPWPASSWSTRR